jgi:hypothetical protein
LFPVGLGRPDDVRPETTLGAHEAPEQRRNMKHLKIIGLAAVAAAAFMAFAGSASAANTLTSPSGTTYLGTLTASATPGTTLNLTATFASVTCTGSSVSGDVTTNNATEASGPITSLSFSGCNSRFDVVPLKNKDGTYGSLSVNQKTEVFGSNTSVTIKDTLFGAHCLYGTSTNTKLGTLNQSTSPTTAATMTISAKLPYKTGSESSEFACGATGAWSGSYTVTTPVPLFSN